LEEWGKALHLFLSLNNKKNTTYSPYATNREGIIRSPKGNPDSPKATTTKGEDLRVKRG
jgi:hypothetical protein